MHVLEVEKNLECTYQFDVWCDMLYYFENQLIPFLQPVHNNIWSDINARACSFKYAYSTYQFSALEKPYRTISYDIKL